MRVYLSCDHAGFTVKQRLASRLSEAGHEVVDLGPDTYDVLDDYPPYCFAVATRVVADPGSLGVVIGGSGNGEQIAANKVAGARAALGWSVETAELAREHNDANVLAVGARMHTPEEAVTIVLAFLRVPFLGEAPGGERHARRIAQITAFESS